LPGGEEGCEGGMVGDGVGVWAGGDVVAGVAELPVAGAAEAPGAGADPGAACGAAAGCDVEGDAFFSD